jgi:hypothetical protein
VAALIMFGVEKIKGSAFGKRIQAKYPASNITKLAYNENGPTILDNATKPRQRGNSASQDDEDFTDKLLDDAFGSGDFNQTTSSTSANKSVTWSNYFKAGAHSNSAQGPSSSPVPASPSTAFTPIRPKGNDPTTPLTLQKKITLDQCMTSAF